MTNKYSDWCVTRKISHRQGLKLHATRIRTPAPSCDLADLLNLRGLDRWERFRFALKLFELPPTQLSDCGYPDWLSARDLKLMLFSQSKKFVFIAVPKTGTTSIEQELRRIDPDILRNKMVFPDGTIRPVNKHITLRDAQAILGEAAGDYRYFAFVREPFDHSISRYHYYANGRGYERFKKRSVSASHLPALGLRVYFARLVPRVCWFLMYPLRHQTAYISDRDGRIALDFCGTLDALDRDLSTMLDMAGYPDTSHEVPHLNIAPRSAISPLEERFLRSVLGWRLRADFNFFSALQAKKV